MFVAGHTGGRDDRRDLEVDLLDGRRRRVLLFLFGRKAREDHRDGLVFVPRTGDVKVQRDLRHRHVRLRRAREVSHRLAYNSAIVVAEGRNADIRKAKAEQAAEEAIYAEKLAEALKDSAKAAWQTKLAQLNAGQSLSSTVREEMRLAR